ncbi:MAG TPA: hypothetical protein VG711_12160 [Phycisphaerales bacterium]|nr:hypothetical protein [Phycisphaerales bacterium]
MSSSPYIPRADAAFRTWAESFATVISGDPARFGLAQAEAASIMQAFERYHTAYMRAIGPSTRTRGAIADKDDARSILENLCRGYAATIRANKGVVDSDKIAIGLRPTNPSRRKRRCPSVAPLLNWIGSLANLDQLFYRDLNNGKGAKPYGAERLELFVAYSGVGEPKPKVSEAKFLGSYRKNPILVRHDAAMHDAGKLPTYFARWAGFNDDVSAWSLAASQGIARRKADAEEKGKDAGEEVLKMAA